MVDFKFPKIGDKAKFHCKSSEMYNNVEGIIKNIYVEKDVLYIKLENSDTSVLIEYKDYVELLNTEGDTNNSCICLLNDLMTTGCTCGGK